MAGFLLQLRYSVYLRVSAVDYSRILGIEKRDGKGDKTHDFGSCEFYAMGIFLPAIFFRIRIEEKMLFTIDGYSEFAKIRSKILPFLW